eukprot:scaffold230035_cov35-Tisochrysis_lutea.AAC.3
MRKEPAVLRARARARGHRCLRRRHTAPCSIPDLSIHPPSPPAPQSPARRWGLRGRSFPVRLPRCSRALALWRECYARAHRLLASHTRLPASGMACTPG